MAANAAGAPGEPGAGAAHLLSLAAPWWLLGLLALPAIRWLHRGGPRRRALPVSHLALWRGAAAPASSAAAQRPPDPAWRRRALLAALLCLALAGPQWPARQPAVTLWVDDSLSMLTQEVNGTRLALGLAQARQFLAATPHGDVEVRALSSPWRAQTAGDDAALAALAPNVLAALLAGAGLAEPGPPPAALLRRERLQWLLTDGTDAALLNGWPGGQQADRVLQVGAVSRNVGIQSLSARRRAGDPNTLDLLVKVTNGGTATEARSLVLSTAAGEFARVQQPLAPGASAWVRAALPVAAGPAPLLRATLQPADALAADDSLELSLAPLLRRRVRVDPRCPPALLAAVGAHPALVVLAAEPALRSAAANAASVPAGEGVQTAPLRALAGTAERDDAQLDLQCTPGAGAPTRPTLRLRADAPPQAWAGPLQWSAAWPHGPLIKLEQAQLAVAARLALQSGDAVLLAAAERPLIVRRAGAVPLIETALDFSAASAAGHAEVPLLLNLLLESLLGGPLLDALAVAERGVDASRVVPAVARPEAPAGGLTGALDAKGAPAESRAPTDGTRPVVMLVLLALLWEGAALVRQWLRLSGGWRSRVQAAPAAAQERP